MGYTPEINHGVLVEMAEHRKDLEKKTKPILDTLRSYQDLPPVIFLMVEIGALSCFEVHVFSIQINISTPLHLVFISYIRLFGTESSCPTGFIAHHVLCKVTRVKNVVGDI